MTESRSGPIAAMIFMDWPQPVRRFYFTPSRPDVIESIELVSPAGPVAPVIVAMAVEKP